MCAIMGMFFKKPSTKQIYVLFTSHSFYSRGNDVAGKQWRAVSCYRTSILAWPVCAEAITFYSDGLGNRKFLMVGWMEYKCADRKYSFTVRGILFLFNRTCFLNTYITNLWNTNLCTSSGVYKFQGARSPGWLNFIPWYPIFVRPQCRTCFISPVQHLGFWDGF